MGPRVKHEDDTSCMTEEQVRVETWWSDDQQDGWYSSITARGDPYWRGGRALLAVVPRHVVYSREAGVAPPMPPCGESPEVMEALFALAKKLVDGA